MDQGHIPEPLELTVRLERLEYRMESYICPELKHLDRRLEQLTEQVAEIENGRTK